MNIKLTHTVGVGKTLLSAYDSALINAGINNNLIILSSVLPKGSEVHEVDSVKDVAGAVGDRLYVVQAEMRSDTPGKVIASALGWMYFEDGTGTLVEHEAEGEDLVAVENELRNTVENSLSDICEFRGIEFDKSKMGTALSIAKVENQPTSVLVIAVFKSESW